MLYVRRKRTFREFLAHITHAKNNEEGGRHLLTFAEVIISRS
jgi:hypothetical protein